MIKNGIRVRYVAIVAMLLLGFYWSVASATGAGKDYPNAHFLATGEWLKGLMDDQSQSG